LLCALLVAAALRFWQLGEAPPGLYRDEAYNGLDALGVLNGRQALFFTANNGREPAYIYLTAGAIALFGRTAIAVRLAAAVAGTMTTALTYRLARVWFGPRAGLFAAWLWAVTLWPVHLSRIGLRPILLAPLLALAFWLGTIAYRRQQRWLWLGAGLAYGATFYTYLAARFTPVLLILLLSYLLLSRPDARRRLWPGLAYFALGALLVLLPLAIYATQQPELLLGRAGQVSILNPAINNGDLWETFWQHVGRSLGLFLWKGDTILRHNPAGRPVFDIFMALPFLVGVGWCLRRLRRPAALALLSWLLIMLGPTILAEDAPHFLRAAGLLPAVTVLPALGLSKIWEWPKLSDALRRGIVIVLALGTLITTIVDYAAYVRRPDTAYLFEAAARELAQKVNEDEASTQFLDRRFWEGWPSIPFLVDRTRPPLLFTPPEMLDPAPLPLSIYAWPHGPLEFVPQAVTAPAVVSVQRGGLARNDLETDAYPLYVRYAAAPRGDEQTVVATFGDAIQLVGAKVRSPAPKQLQVDLYWTASEQLPEPLVAFVHVLSDGERIGQSDRPPAHGFWRPSWWETGIILHDRRVVDLQEAYERARHQIIVGLYKATTRERLPAFDADGKPAGDTWLLR